MGKQRSPATVGKNNPELMASLRRGGIFKAVTQKRMSSITHIEDVLTMCWALELHIYFIYVLNTCMVLPKCQALVSALYRLNSGEL